MHTSVLRYGCLDDNVHDVVRGQQTTSKPDLSTSHVACGSLEGRGVGFETACCDLHLAEWRADCYPLPCHGKLIVMQIGFSQFKILKSKHVAWRSSMRVEQAANNLRMSIQIGGSSEISHE